MGDGGLFRYYKMFVNTRGFKFEIFFEIRIKVWEFFFFIKKYALILKKLKIIGFSN